MKTQPSKHTKSHTKYFAADGTRLVGVTTLVNVMDKSHWLLPWAIRLTQAGLDPLHYRDEKARVGTLAHALSLVEFGGENPDLTDYSQKEIDQAENSFLKFLTWKKAHEIEPILVEVPLVSEAFRFGGTPDVYAKVDGTLTLLDLKSGSGLFFEHWIQIAGYGILLEERGHHIDQRILLNIGRDETENFVEAKRSGPSLEDEVAIFMSCKQIYECKKRLKAE